MNIGLMELYYEISALLDLTLDIKVVAEQSGVSPTTLYNWANGKTKAPRISTLAKVAEYLGYEIHFYKT